MKIYENFSNQVILYDNECPICDLYTDAFVKSQMLDSNGRIAFAQTNEIISMII